MKDMVTTLSDQNLTPNQKALFEDLTVDLDAQRAQHADQFFATYIENPEDGPKIAIIEAFGKSGFDLSADEETADKLIMRFARESILPKDRDTSVNHEKYLAMVRMKKDTHRRYLAFMARHTGQTQDEFQKEVIAIGDMLHEMGIGPAFENKVETGVDEIREKKSRAHGMKATASAKAAMEDSILPVSLVKKALGAFGLFKKDGRDVETAGDPAVDVSAESGAKLEAHWGEAESYEHARHRDVKDILSGYGGTIMTMRDVNHELGLPTFSELRDITNAKKGHLDQFSRAGALHHFQVELKSVELALADMAADVLEQTNPGRYKGVIDILREGDAVSATKTLLECVPHNHNEWMPKETLAFHLGALASYYRGMNERTTLSLVERETEKAAMAGITLSARVEYRYRPREGDVVIAGPGVKDDVSSSGARSICPNLQKIDFGMSVISRGNELLVVDDLVPEDQVQASTSDIRQILAHRANELGDNGASPFEIEMAQKASHASFDDVPLVQKAVDRLESARRDARADFEFRGLMKSVRSIEHLESRGFDMSDRRGELGLS